MAIVPGLRPLNEDRPNISGGRSNPRAQAPDASRFKAPNPSPVAQPVDTYSRPEAPAKDDSLFRLADALASFNPELQKYGTNQARDAGDSQAEARKFLQTHSQDEVREMLKNGTATPLTNMYGQQVYGGARATEDSAKLMEVYNTNFDKDNGNLDELWNQVTQEAYEKFGKDSTFLSNYTQAMGPFKAKFYAMHAAYQAQKTMDDRKDMVYAKWKGEIEQGVPDGMAPVDVANKVFGDFKANHDYLSLPFKDQQEMVLRLADQFATKGQYDTARALLTTERDTGVYKGSLMDDATLGSKASDLMKNIDAQEQKALLLKQSQDSETLLNNQLLTSVRDGTILGINGATTLNKDGTVKEVSRDEIQKRAADLTLEQSQKQAIASGESKDRTYDREVSTFSAAGLKHPVWFSTINGGYSAATMNNLSGDNLPPPLVSGYETYRKLYRDAPQYAAKYTDSDARTFYDTARVFEEDMGMSQQQALTQAAMATKDIKALDPADAIRFKDIDKAVDDASKASFFNFIGFGDPQSENKGDVKATITGYARALARGGMDPKKALEKSQKLFENNYININGFAIRNTSDMDADFKPLVTQRLDEIWKDLPKGAVNSPSDLSIMSTGHGVGQYFVVDKSSGMGIPINDKMTGKPLIIDQKAIADVRKENRTAADAATVAESERKRLDRERRAKMAPNSGITAAAKATQAVAPEVIAPPVLAPTAPPPPEDQRKRGNRPAPGQMKDVGGSNPGVVPSTLADQYNQYRPSQSGAYNPR